MSLAPAFGGACGAASATRKSRVQEINLRALASASGWLRRGRPRLVKKGGLAFGGVLMTASNHDQPSWPRLAQSAYTGAEQAAVDTKSAADSNSQQQQQ